MILEPLSIQLISLIIVSTLFGAIVAWLFFREKIKSLNIDINHKDELLRERQNTIESEKNSLREIFSEAADKSFQKNSDNFLQLAEQNLGKQQEKATNKLNRIVDPLKDLIKHSEETSSKIEGSRIKDKGSLEEKINEIKEHTKGLADETSKLENALNRPQISGTWGEISLERLVEGAGMSKYCDFETQVSMKTDDGLVRPDMIIEMPNNRKVVVDSKTSWPNYIAASNTNNKEEKKKLFQNHTKNVKAQIKDLSVKKYQDHIKNTPAFVILFMPVENMLLSALQEDKGLIEYAINLNIIPATPLNLIAILRTVEHGWRQEDVSANANKIKELGETLLTRLTTYFEHIDRMEDSIGKSVKHYNNAYASFDKKVIPQIEKFKKLGITSKKEIPQLNAIEELPRKSNKRKE